MAQTRHGMSTWSLNRRRHRRTMRTAQALSRHSTARAPNKHCKTSQVQPRHGTGAASARQSAKH
eukprot:6843874-Alexandrium_andersonii.AAC.1